MGDETPWGDEPCEPGSTEWQRRLDWFMAQPSEGWWYLSFVDDSRPEGERWLGACIVPGGNVVQAGQAAWEMGCNPGGQVAGWPLPVKPYEHLIGVLHTDRSIGDTPLWDEVEP